MNQITVEIPQIALWKFDTPTVSVYDIVSRYIQSQYAQKSNYSLYADPLLNPIVFEGTAEENITDLRAKHL